MGWRDVSTDELEEAFDQFAGLGSAAQARLCDLIVEVDARQSWMTDGARSLTDWVAGRLRIRHETAKRLVGVARRLADLPLTARRLAGGELSLDQVEAISRIVTSDTEGELLDRLAGMSNLDLDRMARRHKRLDADTSRSVWERRRLVRQWNLDESELKFHGRLPGVEGRVFDEAIDENINRMGVNPESGMFDPLEVMSADALVELAATSGKGPSTTTQLTVFAELEALISHDDGTAFLDNTAPISNETARRLGCDALIETVVKDGERIIGIGRRSRKIPGWLRRLVIERDGGRCQHPGCGNTRWLQVHHIIFWADGGPTDLDNLILLCGFHHRFVHEHGWHITGTPDRRVFRKADWTPYPRPPAPLDLRLQQLVRTT